MTVGEGESEGSQGDDGDLRVVAQGTFDILHPGHLHYLQEAAAIGELHVIIARRANVTHKARPILADEQRRDMVDALACVHEARLGHLEDIFVPIEEIRPDVILLGHDQHHDEASIEHALEERGLDCEVRRASGRTPEYEGELYSTGDIVERICEERCPPEE
jgi:FAD synthetase